MPKDDVPEDDVPDDDVPGDDVPGDDVNEKLIATKKKWARDGRLLTGTTADPAHDRLPPGQRLVTDWPVLDLGAEPHVTPEKFRLDIDGEVERRVSLRLDEFMALPQQDSVSDIHCVTAWSRYDNHWRGVSASALLAKMSAQIAGLAPATRVVSRKLGPTSGIRSESRVSSAAAWLTRALATTWGRWLTVAIKRSWVSASIA